MLVWCKLPEGKNEVWYEYMYWLRDKLQETENADPELRDKEEWFRQNEINKKKRK